MQNSRLNHKVLFDLTNALWLAKPKLADVEDLVGGLAGASKMPWHSWSTPAQKCITGSKLNARKGTTCWKCYARKGNYVRYPNVLKANLRRWNILMDDVESWAANMAYLIMRKSTTWIQKHGYDRDNLPPFRWHDSGDIQSIKHLEAVVWIAQQCIDTMFWLPTREYAIVRQYLNEGGEIPDNLTIRVSATFVGAKMKLPEFMKEAGVTTSTVGKDDEMGGICCPARFNEGKCGDCRACWSSRQNINYHPH